MSQKGRFSVTGYSWRPGSRFPAALALPVGKRLEELREQTGQSLSPEEVVKEAADPESPLHELFEWDDTAAAAEYRLWQGRQVLGHIQIEYVDTTGRSGETRAYSVVQDTPSAPGRYTSIVAVLSRKDLRVQLLAAAERELGAFQEKYRQLRELSNVFRAIQRFRRRRHGGVS